MTKEQKLMKKDLQEATYICEDGGMVVDGRFTQLGAWRKMVARLRTDCGEVEAEEFMEACSPKDLGNAFLHLMTSKKREEMGADEDTEWYISNKKNEYMVWVWWGQV